MTYLDLINRFWELDKIKQIPLMETKLYLFLLQECNLRRWLNPFELRTRHLAISLGISRKTIAEVRNRLKLTGLIDSPDAEALTHRHTAPMLPPSRSNPVAPPEQQYGRRKKTAAKICGVFAFTGVFV